MQQLDRLRSLLQAIVQRSPSIGYCQGFSFIAATLLTYQTEEEAFWTFVAITESLLPLDYYTNLTGVLIDLCIVESLMPPQLLSQFKRHDFDFKLQISKWFLLLFLNLLSPETELVIWDLLMLHGSPALFAVAIALLKLIGSELAEAEDWFAVQ